MGMGRGAGYNRVMHTFWRLSTEASDSPMALALMAELSAELARRTGDSGRSSFDPQDLDVPRSALVLAWDAAGQAQGCGALRPLAGDEARTGEIKRMYARVSGQGLGRAVLLELERQACAAGYRRLVLSTRRVNGQAVAFYLAQGYAECPAYGRYVGRDVSICLDKTLPAETWLALGG
jgi:GNAT superfamily N-acetyltransferase